MSRILVPLDTSELAEHSLAWATLLANAMGHNVHLLSVSDIEEQLFEYAQIDPHTPLPRAEHALEAYLAKVAGHPALAGVTVTHQVLAGDPATVIAAVAGEQDVEAVCITMRGRGSAGDERAGGPGYGSVTSKLIRTLTKPMLVVPPLSIPAALQRLLVTLDGSTDAERALPLARHLAGALGVRLYLLRVVDPDIGWVLAHDQLEAMASRMLDQARQYLAGVAQDEETAAAVRGKILDTILTSADEQACEIIVMASHGRSGSLRLDLGSTAETVLRETGRPVFLVPIRD